VDPPWLAAVINIVMMMSAAAAAKAKVVRVTAMLGVKYRGCRCTARMSKQRQRVGCTGRFRREVSVSLAIVYKEPRKSACDQQTLSQAGIV
jgi:hypothetical protein